MPSKRGIFKRITVEYCGKLEKLKNSLAILWETG
jgi:hypothetical protein